MHGRADAGYAWRPGQMPTGRGNGATVEPVPESARIVQQLRAIGSELSGLADLVHDIQRLGPARVGLSLPRLGGDLPVTFVGTGSRVARLASLHLLQGQSEPAAREAQENLAYLDWRVRSRRTAAEVEAEVASSLYLPLVD